MEAWKRKQMHSHIYRVPHPFHNEVIQNLFLGFSTNNINLHQHLKTLHYSSTTLTFFFFLILIEKAFDTYQKVPSIQWWYLYSMVQILSQSKFFIQKIPLWYQSIFLVLFVTFILLTGSGGCRKCSEWTGHIHRACGCGKRNPSKCQISRYF